jgi:DNA polymerase III epsilon subunit-like protein
VAKQVSVDIETLGTAENAVILSIGAVKFDETNLYEEFYTTCEIDQQLKDGRTVTGDTIKFWLKQNEAAKSAAFPKEAEHSLYSATHAFAEWYGTDNTQLIWAKPATFDITILNNAYKQFGWFTPPWHYRSIRCLSTLMRTFPRVKPQAQAAIEHHALDDAKEQALFIQLLLDYIKEKQ